jgi:hypothetical protein
VPPLDLPPPDAAGTAEITAHAAVALFIARAHAVRPDLDIDDRAAEDIAAVCLALDGLPLAIELAAARTDVLSPRALRARLQDRFGLLIDGDVDVRHLDRRGAADIPRRVLEQRRPLLRGLATPGHDGLPARRSSRLAVERSRPRCRPGFIVQTVIVVAHEVKLGRRGRQGSARDRP